MAERIWQKCFRPAMTAVWVAHLDHEDGSHLQLSRADEHLVLSFVDPEGNCPPERLSPYFDKLAIANDAWVASAQEALEEYVVLARRVAGPHHESQAGPGKILSLWPLLKGNPPKPAGG